MPLGFLGADRMAQLRALAGGEAAAADPAAALSQIRSVLLAPAPVLPLSPAPSAEISDSSPAGGDAAAAAASATTPQDDFVLANERLLGVLQGRLEKWEGVVRTFESPSRVLRWAATPPPAADAGGRAGGGSGSAGGAPGRSLSAPATPPT